MESENMKMELKAVEEPTDQAGLADYIKKRAHTYGTEYSLALDKLTDQAIIVDIIKSDDTESECVRLDAVARLTDKALAQQMYLHVAENTDNAEVRRRAAEKLDDKAAAGPLLQKAYIELVTESTKLNDNRQYLGKITGQAAIAGIAIDAWYDYIALEAVKLLTDQPLLAEVAKKADDIQVRNKALAKLTEQPLLVEVAKNANDAGTRFLALMRLTGQSDIVEIAKTDSSPENRVKAAEMLADKELAQEIYADIVLSCKSDDDTYYEERAFGKLTDQAMIARVAKNAKGIFRFTAALELTDPELAREVLFDMIKNTDAGELRLIKAEKIPYPDVLAEYVKKVDYDISMRLVYKISDPALLANIMKRASDNYARVLAMRRSGLMCEDGEHKWTAVDVCHKKCTVCGVGFHDHDYESRHCGSGNKAVYYYECSKCGETTDDMSTVVNGFYYIELEK